MPEPFDQPMYVVALGELPDVRACCGQRREAMQVEALLLQRATRFRSARAESGLRTWRAQFSAAPPVISPISLNWPPSTVLRKITAAMLSPFVSHSTGRA
jgi:hypothetical protein